MADKGGGQVCGGGGTESPELRVRRVIYAAVEIVWNDRTAAGVSDHEPADEVSSG